MRRSAALAGLALVLVAGGLSVGALGSGGGGCPGPTPVALERVDGQWVVLEEQSLLCGPDRLVVRDDDWRRVDTVDLTGRIDGSPADRRADRGLDDVVDLAVDAEGDRRAVTATGALLVLNETWGVRRGANLTAQRQVRLEGVEDGAGDRYWLIGTTGDLEVVEAGERKTVVQDDRSIEDVESRRGTLRVLERRGVGAVVETYRVVEKGESVDLRRRSTTRLGPEASGVVAVERGPDGRWWTVDHDGDTRVYTADWEYTGRRYGSSPVDRTLDGIEDLFPALCVALLGVGWTLVRTSRRTALGVGVGVILVSTGVGIVVEQSLLSGPLRAVYRLPHAWTAALLAVPVFAVGGYWLHRRRRATAPTSAATATRSQADETTDHESRPVLEATGLVLAGTPVLLVATRYALAAL